MMGRDLTLKPREPRRRKEYPPEKLLEILMGIYPESVALDLFKQLQGEDGDDHG